MTTEVNYSKLQETDIVVHPLKTGLRNIPQLSVKTIDK